MGRQQVAQDLQYLCVEAVAQRKERAEDPVYRPRHQHLFVRLPPLAPVGRSRDLAHGVRLVARAAARRRQRIYSEKKLIKRYVCTQRSSASRFGEPCFACLPVRL